MSERALLRRKPYPGTFEMVQGHGGAFPRIGLR